MKYLHVLLVPCLLFSCTKDETGNVPDPSTFAVKGTYLTDPCGDTIILKGVNKMSVFDEEDSEGDNYFAEIAKTNANSVRIVWQSAYSNGQPSDPNQLEALIKNCMKEEMIPIVEMHDATCNWNALDDVVDYWVKPEILSIVKKYEHALLVNIANEAGDYLVDSGQFLQKYKSAITKLRNAGIRTTLIIDAPDCGKNLEEIAPVTNDLTQHDPLKNIMFSAHPYWSKTAGATPAFVKQQLDAAASASVPLILGELCAYGGWPGVGEDDTQICTAKGEVDYKTLLVESAAHDYGWLLWEWGPGNGFYDREPVVLCPAMDMTTDGSYQSLLDIKAGDPNAWVKDAVIDNNLGLRKTAQKTAYLTNGFQCE